jgi:hypothetical protein
MKIKKYLVLAAIVGSIGGNCSIAQAQTAPTNGFTSLLNGLMNILAQVQSYLPVLTSTAPFNQATTALLKNNTFGLDPAALGFATNASSLIGAGGLMTGNTANYGNILQAAIGRMPNLQATTTADLVQQNLNQAALFGINTQAATGSANTSNMISQNSPVFSAAASTGTVYQSTLDATTHSARMLGEQGAVLNNITAQNTLTQTGLGVIAEGQQQDRQRAVTAQAKLDRTNAAVDRSRQLSDTLVPPR